MKAVVCMVGPTAVGKTAVIEELADLPIEIISADSMQMYRGMDLGTAKPSWELRNRVPHHLVDRLDPHEYYSVGDFVRDCERCIDDAEGTLPLITGGTPFYVKTFLYGLPATPVVADKLRERIRRKVDERGSESCWEEVRVFDPVSAERIHPRDGYRVSRALEIIEATGLPPSSLRASQQLRDDYRVVLIGLFQDRDVLKARIAERVARMMREGLAEEVCGLLQSGVSPEDPGMRAIGYKEFCGVIPEDGEMWSDRQLQDIASEITRNSWRYAKRQLTFFRQLPRVQWIHAENVPQIRESIRVYIAS